MTALIFHAIGWPTLVTALLTFGFAPGLVLRLIVLAFERNDPRRRELLAELYYVPRVERPFWVAEKIELALMEGLGGRLQSLIRRLHPRRRLAKAWQEYKHETLEMGHPVATSLAAWAVFLSLIEAEILLHAKIYKLIAFALWATFTLVFSSYNGHHSKPFRERGEAWPANRFQLALCLTLAPATYVILGYLLTHDIASLISGDISPSYWIGACLALLGLIQPITLILSALMHTRRHGSGMCPACAPSVISSGQSR